MTENNLELNTSSCECETENAEQESHHSSSHHGSSHHRHSHHSGSHHSHSHHGSSHHSSSHHSSSHHGSSHHGHSHHGSSSHGSSKHSHSKRKRSSKSNQKTKFSIYDFLKQKAQSRTTKNIPSHRKTSQRLLFFIVLTTFVVAAISGIISEENAPTASKPGYARSEADQLRSQITILQLKVTELENELNMYKQIYGEINPDKQKN